MSGRRSYVVAQEGEIPPGGCKIVTVERREIGVFNVDGEYFALRNRCPHQGAALCAGHVLPALRSERPGDYSLGGERLLQCPWHGWEFDLRTGRSWFDPRSMRVRAYKVGLEEITGPHARDAGACEPDDSDPDAASEPASCEPDDSDPDAACESASCEPDASGPDASGPDAGEPGADGPLGMLPGPHRVETYEVAVSHRRVVLELGAG